MAEQPFGRVRLIEMMVESVRVHMLSSQHVVILKESERERYLPIWIGPSEANAIAMRLRASPPSGRSPTTSWSPSSRRFPPP